MKKEMSSFDVRSVVTELSVLEGAHMDKIFHWGAGNVLFRLNIQGEGKKELFFKDKKWLYSPDVKPETPTMPTSFASFLRKYISVWMYEDASLYPTCTLAESSPRLFLVTVPLLSDGSFLAIFPISKMLWGYTAWPDTDSLSRRHGRIDGLITS